MRTVGPMVMLAAALAGCGSGAGQNNAQAAPAATQTNLAAQPVKEEHRSLQLTPQWLAGRWQTGDGDCSAGDTFLTFAPDGRYSFMQETGRWSLAGNALTVEITEAAPDGDSQAGDKSTTEVHPVGPNEAEFRREGGEPIRVFRCTSGG